MLFDRFLELIPKIENEPLLSSKAHLKMAPLERLKYYDNYDYSIHNPRKSAVLSLFYPKDTQTYLLLIVRSEYVGVHSAQISFPGGKMEHFDASLQETALRETEEEVGIKKEKIEIIKPFSELYIPPSNFLVSPFLGFTTEPIEPKIDPREVSHILELPVLDLLDNRLVSNVKLSTSYANDIQVPAFIIADHIVWGATAMILSEIKDIINKAL